MSLCQKQCGRRIPPFDQPPRYRDSHNFIFTVKLPAKNTLVYYDVYYHNII